jgi:hypothetical protein
LGGRSPERCRRRHTLEDLVLELQGARLTAQLDELFMLSARQALTAASSMSAWAIQFRRQLSLTEIGGDLRDLLLAQTSQFNGEPTELRRVGSGHMDILPAATMVASGSVAANPGEAHVESVPADMRP